MASLHHHSEHKAIFGHFCSKSTLCEAIAVQTVRHGTICDLAKAVIVDKQCTSLCPDANCLPTTAVTPLPLVSRNSNLNKPEEAQACQD